MLFSFVHVGQLHMDAFKDEKQIVIFSSVLLTQDQCVIIDQKVINGLKRFYTLMMLMILIFIKEAYFLMAHWSILILLLLMYLLVE